MANIKLFKLSWRRELVEVEHEPSLFKLEKELQDFCEAHLEKLFNIRLLDGEHVITAGRIDTLGIDENNCPVVIEYKRHGSSTAFNQSVTYLNRLKKDKGDFIRCCLKIKMTDIEKINWSKCRVICIAQHFDKNDHAMKEEVKHDVDLIRYHVYGGGEYIAFEFDKDIPIIKKGKPARQGTKPATQESKPATQGNKPVTQESKPAMQRSTPATKKTVEKAKKDVSVEKKTLFEEIEAFIFALGDDVQKRELKYYNTYARIKTFASLRLQTKNVILYVEIPYADIVSPPDFVRDVSKIGRLGIGETEIAISSREDFERVKPYIEQAYEASK